MKTQNDKKEVAILPTAKVSS